MLIGLRFRAFLILFLLGSGFFIIRAASGQGGEGGEEGGE